MPVLLALAAISATVSPPCHIPRAMPVAGAQATRARPAMHNLGDEPPADEIVAVYRQVDRCPVPIVLRRAIGTADRGMLSRR